MSVLKRVTGAAGLAPEGEPGSWVSDAARDKFLAAYERAFALWPQPGEEFDVNNHRYYPSTDYVGRSDDYPEADPARREEIALAHRRDDRKVLRQPFADAPPIRVAVEFEQAPQPVLLLDGLQEEGVAAARGEHLVEARIRLEEGTGAH